jgi:hypothetical protein
MMRIKAIKIGVVGISFLLISVASAQTKHGVLEYKREILFETRPWTAPYYLPLHYGQNSYHFEHKQEGRLKARELKQDTAFAPMAPMVDYFWALNSGELVFIYKNQGLMKSGAISVLDYQNGKWMDYLICEDYHDYFSNIWPGPSDELYFNYYSLKEPTSPDGSRFHLKKYDLERSRWINEPEYLSIDLMGPSASLQIAPNGKIYLSNNEPESESGQSRALVYNKNGQFESATAADGEVSNGLLFSFKITEPESTNVRSVFKIDRSGLLQERFGGLARTDFDFKATFDSLIIIYCHRTIDRYSEDGKYFPINLPSLVVLNPIGGLAVEIKLADSLDSDFNYYNVSDIAVNYKGEIFALFVYFDNPYRITGDESIVLYRWKRA